MRIPEEDLSVEEINLPVRNTDSTKTATTGFAAKEGVTVKF
jgi:hypothetical protein